MVTLTEQQAKTLNLFLEGKNIKEIALTLGVSYSRAINILNEILVKTELKSRRELLINGKTLDYITK